MLNETAINELDDLRAELAVMAELASMNTHQTVNIGNWGIVLQSYANRLTATLNTLETQQN